MPETENQPIKDYRGQLMSRAQERFPDRSFSERTDESGQMVQPKDDIYQAVNEMLDEYDSKQKEYQSNEDRLTNLFASDPRSARFMNRWVERQDPLAALIETFGDDFLEAMKDDESKARYIESQNKWLEEKAEEERSAEERENNWNQSLEALDKFKQEKGLTDDQAVQVILRLNTIGMNAIDGKYAPEDFELALKAMNYSSDVASARQEGEIAGRNAKIQSRMRERQQTGAMPPALSGQGARAREAAPAKPKSIWSGIE